MLGHGRIENDRIYLTVLRPQLVVLYWREVVIMIGVLKVDEGWMADNGSRTDSKKIPPTLTAKNVFSF